MTQDAFRILFVCSGNTCRSPLAEVLARGLAAEGGPQGLEVRSAGTFTVSGRPASLGSLRAAQRHGFQLDHHRSTLLSQDSVEWADLILTMGPSHLARVLDLGGEGKSAMLGAYALGAEPALEPAVPDPFGGDDTMYEDTFLTLQEMVGAVLDRLTKEPGE